MPIGMPLLRRPFTRGQRQPAPAAIALSSSLSLLALGTVCRAAGAQSVLPPVVVEDEQLKSAPKRLAPKARNLSDKADIAGVSVDDLASPTSPLFESGTGRAVFAAIKLKW